jgi:hypothetical protein
MAVSSEGAFPMKIILWRIAVVMMVLTVVGETPARAQPTATPTGLRLPVSGTIAKGGEFTGTISINRFEQRDNQIVAVGFVSGVLSRGGRTLGTAVAGEVTWPVVLKSGGQLIAYRYAPGTARPMQIAWSPGGRPAFSILRVQAQSCQVLDIALGPINVDILGFQVALSAVTFSLTGGTGPLGDLVCAVSDLLGNVAGLVNLLNSILGLLTGLLGGLTGGLGGAIPMP